MAAPVETIARRRFGDDAARLSLAGERRVAGYVLGLPINMDGSEGPRAQATRAFARNLAKLTELPIALWDEQLSTAAVERALIEADVSRDKRKAVINQHAAAYILQGALDRLLILSREAGKGSRPSGSGRSANRAARSNAACPHHHASHGPPPRFALLRGGEFDYPSGRARWSSVSVVRASISSAP